MIHKYSGRKKKKSIRKVGLLGSLVQILTSSDGEGMDHRDAEKRAQLV